MSFLRNEISDTNFFKLSLIISSVKSNYKKMMIIIAIGWPSSLKMVTVATGLFKNHFLYMFQSKIPLELNRVNNCYGTEYIFEIIEYHRV